jgi:hypothetical protein
MAGRKPAPQWAGTTALRVKKQKARPDGRGRAYDFTVARDVKRFGAGKVEVVEGKGEYNFQFREMKKLTGQKSWGRYFIFS